MFKSKFFYFLLVFLFPAASYGCSCSFQGVVNNFQESEFVAKAKIIKITPDLTNSDYHDAVIEIISLYKGEHIRKIKIMSSLNSSCNFLPVENTTWIIFAQRWQGMLSFGFCSGSMNMDRTFDAVQYPNAEKNYGNTIKLREDVITFLSKNSILNPNPSMLYAYNPELVSFKGYKNKNTFTVFQVDVNSDFSIGAIEQLKKLKNKKLNKLVFNSMKTKLTFGGKPLAKPARIILFCFFYEQNGSEQSFFSFIDV
jgi:hypothetical protein